MNKRQLFILWIAVCIVASMVWFPGSWFGYIIDGYPVLKPESIEFLVKIIIPLLAFTLLLLYCLRDKTVTATSSTRLPVHRRRVLSLFPFMIILAAGLVFGFIGGYYMIARDERPLGSKAEEARKGDESDDEFRNFCRREGYRNEVEALTTWLREEHAYTIAILYNGDDAYSHDLYTYFSQRLPDEKITIALSDRFKEGEKSFLHALKALESAQPEAIVFLGSYEERVAFLETIAQQPQADFWHKRLNKIRWIE